MKTKQFNPYDWIPKPATKKQAPPVPVEKSTTGLEHDTEVIVRRIESYQLDLTLNYQDWLTIGFALADYFGENGRNYFHRLSRFYPGYDFNNCNRQYDKCLSGRRSGVTIKTFFYLAQSAGINIRV
ncbi:MAG: PriCT-2 domain-containing protein [Mariniphaga sp.]|nr:PriCT-2 domain-containing protein [Mariniphaga sp.]